MAELGQNEEAANWLEKCLASDPSSFLEQSAYYQLVRVYQKLNRKADADRALEKLKQLKAEAAKSITQTDPASVPGAPTEPAEQAPPKQP